MPVEEVLELVVAASYLDVQGLYHCGCQAMAALIKGKGPVAIRRILRQQADLNLGEYADILASLPWLDPETDVHDPVGDDSDTLDFQPEVLFTVFEKLSRADLERLQLVNAQFRDVIRTVGRLGEEHGPLRRLRMVSIGSASADDRRIYLQDGTHIIFRDHSTFVQRLKFCAIELLTFDISEERSDELLHRMLPSKMAWKNATVHAFTNNFGSGEAFKYAFSDLLLCKKIRVVENVPASFMPTSFLRLPATMQCSELDVGHLPFYQDLGSQLYSVEVHEIVEWLEREHRKKPSRLSIAGHAINGGPHALIEALTEVFLAASRPNAYVVRIRLLKAVDVDEQYHKNKTTHECFEFAWTRLTTQSMPTYWWSANNHFLFERLST